MREGVVSRFKGVVVVVPGAALQGIVLRVVVVGEILIGFVGFGPGGLAAARTSTSAFGIVGFGFCWEIVKVDRRQVGRVEILSFGCSDSVGLCVFCNFR